MWRESRSLGLSSYFILCCSPQPAQWPWLNSFEDVHVIFVPKAKLNTVSQHTTVRKKSPFSSACWLFFGWYSLGHSSLLAQDPLGTSVPFSVHQDPYLRPLLQSLLPALSHSPASTGAWVCAIPGSRPHIPFCWAFWGSWRPVSPACQISLDSSQTSSTLSAPLSWYFPQRCLPGCHWGSGEGVWHHPSQKHSWELPPSTDHQPDSSSLTTHLQAQTDFQPPCTPHLPSLATAPLLPVDISAVLWLRKHCKNSSAEIRGRRAELFPSLCCVTFSKWPKPQRPDDTCYLNKAAYATDCRCSCIWGKALWDSWTNITANNRSSCPELINTLKPK